MNIEMIRFIDGLLIGSLVTMITIKIIFEYKAKKAKEELIMLMEKHLKEGVASVLPLEEEREE